MILEIVLVVYRYLESGELRFEYSLVLFQNFIQILITFCCFFECRFLLSGVFFEYFFLLDE